MIPTDSCKPMGNKPQHPPKVQTEFTPDPVSCSEAKCDQQPLFAYLLKGEKQFKFCCNIHQGVLGAPTFEFDTIEHYLKKRKRKMYNIHLKEMK